MATEVIIAFLKYLDQRCGTSQFEDYLFLTSIEHLFKQEETAQQAQCPSKITAWDTFIGKQQLSYSFTAAFTGVLISVSTDFILNTFSHNLMVKLSE